MDTSLRHDQGIVPYAILQRRNTPWKATKKMRMLRILELLRNETDEQHPLSTAQIERILRERWGLEAYRITIQKDIAALVAAGYEIETIRSTQNKYYFSGRLFELPELKLLIDAVESSKFITEKKSRVLTEKLTGLAGVG